jgi:hypothetical protein
MQLMGVAARAILLPLDALGVQALVLVGEVVSVFARLASEDDFFSGHCCFLLLNCEQRTNCHSELQSN